MRYLYLLALLSALTMPGCSPDMLQQATAGKAPPAKKASQTSQDKLGYSAPEKPAAGSGTAAKAAPTKVCPEIGKGAYDALARPVALPEQGKPVDQAATKKWVEALEGQVKDLQGHLAEAIDSAGCLAQH